jgi:hypothetical protein
MVLSAVQLVENAAKNYSDKFGSPEHPAFE